MEDNKMTTFNLKLQEGTRRDFKKITHDRGTTMQAVLAALTESYVENPDKFKVKMEIMSGAG